MACAFEVLIENKAFHFSKRALRAGTARNKWLKKTLSVTIDVNSLKVNEKTKFRHFRT